MTIGIVVVLCRDNIRVATRHDDVDLEPDQVLGELREPLRLPVGEAVLDHHVPSRDVAEITQAVFEGFHEARRLLARRAQQNPDSGNLPPLLRLGGERRGEESSRTNNKGAPIHCSIT
jgi:hypothetical protein